MLNCKQASELLSQALDRDITLREKILLKLHLLICHGCSNFSKQMTVMRKACRSYLEK
ncbi:MAG: zf-HC2 domain-containing protein [Gallionella sp.]|nr:zf-HC2 domain-containing protein [Gallionella sp.]